MKPAVVVVTDTLSIPCGTWAEAFRVASDMAEAQPGLVVMAYDFVLTKTGKLNRRGGTRFVTKL